MIWVKYSCNCSLTWNKAGNNYVSFFLASFLTIVAVAILPESRVSRSNLSSAQEVFHGKVPDVGHLRPKINWQMAGLVCGFWNSFWSLLQVHLEAKKTHQTSANYRMSYQKTGWQWMKWWFPQIGVPPVIILISNDGIFPFTKTIHIFGSPHDELETPK